jgi:hypothetical protein
MFKKTLVSLLLGCASLLPVLPAQAADALTPTLLVTRVSGDKVSLMIDASALLNDLATKNLPQQQIVTTVEKAAIDAIQDKRSTLPASARRAQALIIYQQFNGHNPLYQAATLSGAGRLCILHVELAPAALHAAQASIVQGHPLPGLVTDLEKPPSP